MYLSINLDSTQEVFDAFEDVDKSIVACLDVLGRLADTDMIKRQLEGGKWYERREGHQFRKKEVLRGGMPRSKR